MKVPVLSLCGLGVVGVFAVVAALRTEQPAPVPGTGTSSSPPPVVTSDRQIDTGGVLETGQNFHLRIEAHPKVSVADEVRAEIAEHGPKVAAEVVRDDFSLLPAKRKIKIEEVMRQWSRQSAEGAGSWIEEQLAVASSDENFNQAALSGYIESIALVDPEAAAEAAELLEESVPEAKKELPLKIISGDPGFPGDRDFLTPDRK